MGMYDYINCEAPLDVEGMEGRQFQTKDTPAQFLDTYTITADGKLMHEEYDLREEITDKAPLGMFLHRDDPRTVHLSDFTGSICFYGFKQEGRGFSDSHGWVSFVALFDDGVLVRPIKTMNNRDGDGDEDES